MKSILPIFIIIILGTLFYLIKLARYNWVEVLNEYVVRIGFPALIISTLVKLEWNPDAHGKILIANSIFVLACFGFAILVGFLANLSRQMKRTIFLAAAYGNIAYLGIPIIEMFRGKDLLPEASLITACYLFWIFTVGMVYLEYSKTGSFGIKLVLVKLLKNPIVIAIIIGIVILILKIKLPVVALKPLEMISASVTPVILFSLGIFLGSSKIGTIKSWIPVLMLVFFVLLLKPAIYYFSIRTSLLNTSIFYTSILDAGMPLALTPFALSREFDLDAGFLAKGIVLSTLLSIFSLSMWHSFLMR